MDVLKGLVIAACLLFVVPAAAQEAACAPPLQPMMRAELYFGRGAPGHGRVDARRWARFLAGDLTPRFPDGLTVLDGRGQWRDPATGRISREASTVVIIVAADSARTRERLAAAAEAYKRRFRQTSVGIVMQAVCAAF